MRSQTLSEFLATRLTSRGRWGRGISHRRSGRGRRRALKLEPLEKRQLLAAVALYDDPAFVDTSDGADAESDNLQASLVDLGHAVNTFTGTAAADFSAALGGDTQVLVIPELEVADLNAALAAGAKSAIADFVSLGGGMIVTGDSDDFSIDLLNGVFGFSLGGGANAAGVNTLDAAQAIGTQFLGGPSPIPSNSLTRIISSLPGGSRSIYTDTTPDTTVALMPFGSGQIVYLGWDWFESDPPNAGLQDGGWQSVLQRAVSQVTPEVSDLLPDEFEPNDSLSTATILGSLPKITLRDLTLHDFNVVNDTDATDDVDFYKLTAQDTGKVIVNLFFWDAIDEPDLRILDVNGNELVTADERNIRPGLDVEFATFPVVSQEEYFIEVTSGDEASAAYDLEIENFAAPTADLVILDRNDDTGMSHSDDVTSTEQPRVFIEADLFDFDAEGIAILDPGDADFGDAPGAAVEVFVNGRSVGFADPIAGTGNTLFQFTFGDLDTFPADPVSDPPGGLQTNDVFAIGCDPATPEFGWLNFVKAAVRIFDGQGDPDGEPDSASGRTQLTEDPLLLTFDPNAPAAPSTPDLAASSDSGASATDNVTNVSAPAFQGTGEAGAKVRIFADGVLVGQGVVGTDGTDGDPDNCTGSWEITVEPLADGVYDITAVVEDAAGNISDRSEALQIEIDTIRPDTPLLDLVEDDDTGRHDDDNITNENAPRVTMTTEDPNADLHQLLFEDNLVFRIFDRFEETGEFLLYDSAQDDAVDDQNVPADDFTILELILETLPEQFIALNPAGNAAVDAGGFLEDGVHNLKLEAEDRAGNISRDFLLDLLIDTEAFQGEGNLHPDSDTGVWGFPGTMEDGIIGDMTPAFFGTAEANNLVIAEISSDGGPFVPAGTAVAVPLDGDDAFQPPNAPYDIVEGNWELQTVLNLEDGEHAIQFTYEDPAGNRATSEEMAFFIDTQGPRITDVTLGEVIRVVDGGLVEEFDGETSLFEPKPSNGPDPLVSSIVIHFSDLPERTDDFDYPALLEALAEEEGNYRVTGDHNGNIAILDVNVTFVTEPGEPATAEVELVFHLPGADGEPLSGDDVGAPLPDDRFTLWVSDTIADPAGNPLDGESGAAAPFEGTGDPPPVPPPGHENFPNQDAIFPTGDGQHGGEFHARFTVDSRPEIGTWSAGSVYIDTNGNFTFDPQNPDFTNRDVVYDLGFTTDFVFAGNFTDGDTADGFDKLAVYGRVGGSFRWLIDLDNDGVPDLESMEPPGYRVIGQPVAGNFDGDADNGDEIGLFTGTRWLLDTNHDFMLSDETPIASALRGSPVVGDFDGDGTDDLATLNYQRNRFEFDLSASGLVGDSIDLPFGEFIGVRERAVAADMNQDGIDDIGLWVPDRSGVLPEKAGEWYFLVSRREALEDDGEDEVGGTVDALDHPFTPIPFGDDIFAQFGDEFAVPIVGNFDPPLPGGAAQPDEDQAGNDQGGNDQDGADPLDPVTEGADPLVAELTGTPGNDLVEITVGSTPGAWKIVVNGVPQKLGSEVTSVNFDGLGGDDTVTLTGTAGADALELWPGRGTLTGKGYALSLAGVESVSADGLGGDDQAVLHGSDAADEFVSWAGGALMTTGTGQQELSGFETIHGYGGAGSDLAKMYASHGDDVYDAFPDKATFSGPGFHNTAAGFEVVYGYAWGGEDTAHLRGSAADETFRASPVEAALWTTGSYNRAKNFAAVTAYAGTGKDTAELHGSDGDDSLVARPDHAALSGEGYDNQARGFDEVRAYAGSGGFDRGEFTDSDGDDLFFATSRAAGMIGDTYANYASGFDDLHALATGTGTDVAKLYDSPANDVYSASPDGATLSGEGFSNRVERFDAVHAYATAGGIDTANLTGSDADDTFVGRSVEGSLFGTGFFNRAKYFETLNVFGAEGSDRAVLHDAALQRAGDPGSPGVNYVWDALLHDFEQAEDRSTGRQIAVQAADEVLRAYWV